MTSATWTEPGAEQVAPGVHRIALPLPDDGLRAVNVYALETPDGLVLVDGGWDLPSGRDALALGLGQLGAGLGDVRRFLVTHVHRDHYTLAVGLRAETGASVGLGAGERPALEHLQEPGRVPMGAQLDQLRVMGAADLAETMAALVGDHRVDPAHWPSPDDWLVPGTLDLAGGRALEVVETPGHTAGHVVFHDLAAGLLFAGDHVLPRITPSIGFEPVLTPDPLGDFLRSLALVRSRPDAVLLPAHGPVAPSVHARVDELLAHHDTRLDQVEQAAAGRGATVHEAASALRWTRREHRLADLDPFNAMLAVFETQAHLVLLVAQGRLAVQRNDEVDRYS